MGAFLKEIAFYVGSRGNNEVIGGRVGTTTRQTTMGKQTLH